MAQAKKSKSTKRTSSRATKKSRASKATSSRSRTGKRATSRSGELKKSGSPVVGILTGSPNDLPVVLKARDTLHDLDIPCDVRVLSAHRSPERALEYATKARSRGIEVLIACAGMAAHLAGVVAAHTTLPVIGVPLNAGKLDGMDALLATVQMPPGIPVATVGIDGSRNAGLLAARILSGTHPELHARLEAAMQAARARYDSADISVPGQAARKSPKRRK